MTALDEKNSRAGFGKGFDGTRARPGVASSMRGPFSLLIVDENELTRSLVVRALMRRFPHALVQQCAHEDVGCFAAHNAGLHVIVAGSAVGAESSLHLVRNLRAANAETPIVLLAHDIDSEAAHGAGATHLIEPENWIRVPDVIAAIDRWPVHLEAADQLVFGETG